MMENLKFTVKDTRLEVDGFPEAVKVVRVGGEKAHKLADLSLHADDLEFAKQCLRSVNEDATTPFVQQALWRSAIVHYVKCFGEGVRRPLKAKVVYANHPAEAFEAQDYFLKLRNKHIVHDVSKYASAEVGAIVNGSESQHKIAKVVCTLFLAQTLEQDGFSNLTLLVDHALEWVEHERNTLCDAITADLEKETYEALMQRKDMVHDSFKPADFKNGRSPRVD